MHDNTPPCLYNYNDVTMDSMAPQITSLTNVYSAVDSGADQRKHQSSASLAFVREIHRGPVNSPHKWPVTRKMLPFDDVIMILSHGRYCVVLCFDHAGFGMNSIGYFCTHWKNMLNRHQTTWSLMTIGTHLIVRRAKFLSIKTSTNCLENTITLCIMH